MTYRQVKDLFEALFEEVERDYKNVPVTSIARRLGVSDNWLQDAKEARRLKVGYRKPQNHILRALKINGGHKVSSRAQALLETRDPEARHHLTVINLPPDLVSLEGNVIRFEEAVRLMQRRKQTSSPSANLPSLIRRYTHAALQLKSGAFPHGGLAQSLADDPDIGILEAYAIAELIHGFRDAKYFRSVAAAIRARSKSTPFVDLPLHAFGVIALSTIMREPALPTEDDESKILRRMTREFGRTTGFVFLEHNDRRPRDTVNEIVSLVEPCLTLPLALYGLLTPELRVQKCELPEPAVVGAAASVAALRATIALIAATNTLIQLEHMSACLETVVSKVAELSRESYGDLVARVREAFEGLQDAGAEADRTGLQREVTLTHTALFREEGVWFVFNDELAVLNKFGSRTERLMSGGERHRFLDPRHRDGWLPTARGEAPIWLFRDAAGIPGGSGGAGEV